MIVCLCDGRMFHGGPTDRLRGILTTYREAKRSGIPFYISWRSPFNLEDYYIPAGFDWRIDPDKLIYDKRDSFPLIIEDEPNLYAKWRIKRGVKINVSQLHVYSNADNARGEYSELFREVFRPSEALQKEVDIHLEKLGPRFHAFTFRFLQLLGDFKDWYQVTLPEEERIRLMDKVVDEFHKLISKIPEGYKILVTSDSSRFLQRIKNEDERIYIVPGEVKNIDLLKGEHQGAWMKTFVDQQLLMHAEKVVLMRTGDMFKSGFPRFAAEVGGAQFIDHKF